MVQEAQDGDIGQSLINCIFLRSALPTVGRKSWFSAGQPKHKGGSGWRYGIYTSSFQYRGGVCITPLSLFLSRLLGPVGQCGAFDFSTFLIDKKSTVYQKFRRFVQRVGPRNMCKSRKLCNFRIPPSQLCRAWLVEIGVGKERYVALRNGVMRDNSQSILVKLSWCSLLENWKIEGKCKMQQSTGSFLSSSPYCGNHMGSVPQGGVLAIHSGDTTNDRICRCS